MQGTRILVKYSYHEIGVSFLFLVEFRLSPAESPCPCHWCRACVWESLHFQRDTEFRPLVSVGGKGLPQSTHEALLMAQEHIRRQLESLEAWLLPPRPGTAPCTARLTAHPKEVGPTPGGGWTWQSMCWRGAQTIPLANKRTAVCLGGKLTGSWAPLGQQRKGFQR